jgi:hypothetical protein
MCRAIWLSSSGPAESLVPGRRWRLWLRLGALRRARVAYAIRGRRGSAHWLDAWGRLEDDQAVIVVASWSYVDSWYQTTGEAWLAASAAARAREARRIAREELRTTSPHDGSRRSIGRAIDCREAADRLGTSVRFVRRLLRVGGSPTSRSAAMCVWTQPISRCSLQPAGSRSDHHRWPRSLPAAPIPATGLRRYRARGPGSDGGAVLADWPGARSGLTQHRRQRLPAAPADHGHGGRGRPDHAEPLLGEGSGYRAGCREWSSSKS